MPPRVLVLLAAFNGAAVIERQLRSILVQDNVTVGIVVADDASADATVRVVESLGDPRVAVVRRDTGTGSAAQNFVALIAQHSASGYDYVALSDQDDCWLPDKLHRACTSLLSSGAAGYASGVMAVWPDDSRRAIRQSARRSRGDFLFEGAGQGCTYVLTAALYERIRAHLQAHAGLARQLVYHDWAIYALTRVWNLNWYFDPVPSLLYTQHGGNDIGTRSSLHGARRRVALLREGRYRRQMEIVFELCRATGASNAALLRWARLRAMQAGLSRRLKVAGFCLFWGRRRRLDALFMATVALAGWI
jgi:rhamnosyltransferase